MKESEEILRLNVLCKPPAPLERGSFADDYSKESCTVLFSLTDSRSARIFGGTLDRVQEAHHCCSQTAKLPHEHLTETKNENSIKDERVTHQ